MAYSSRTRVAAVTASLIFALSGGVALADEATTVQQDTAQPAAQEQVATGEQSVQGQTATGDETTGAQGATGQSATSGDPTSDSATDQAKDGTEAEQTSGDSKSDESKAGEESAADAQKTSEAGSQETAGATDAKSATNSAEATTAADDVALEPQVAEYYENIRNKETGTSESKAIDEQEIEWVRVDPSMIVHKYSSPENYRSVDEDGFRIYYYNNQESDFDRIMARLKIGENGELFAPAKDGYLLTTDHTAGILFDANHLNGDTSIGLTSFIKTDDPSSVFTKSGKIQIAQYVSDKTYYYYPGGEYGAKGWYYLVDEGASFSGGNYDGRFIGMYALYEPRGGTPGSGTSGATEDKAAPAVLAAYDGYESGTATVTPATGTAYVSATAAETTPATSDATSIAGAVAAAVSALGALGLGKAIRRK